VKKRSLLETSLGTLLCIGYNEGWGTKLETSLRHYMLVSYAGITVNGEIKEEVR
jgi:hypothetical protein